ncbi:MAG: phosphopyruvate hydratase [Candidatus Curtissbacteria bacterium]|nr:phosphopyruvate hydratase [bacterium]MDZ4209850.1 phosphopyruvate hydratase [Candidatus Curtissbacteria bacterium]
MSKIHSIIAEEILDSRGIPTVETTVVLDDGWRGVASVPSGTSLGYHEAVELRDSDPERYNGMGVLRAVSNVNQIIAPRLVGMDPTHQAEIDRLLITLDGTKDKSKLGANAVLAVSQGVCEAAAASLKMPLYKYIYQQAAMFGVLSKHAQENNLRIPTPTFNLINGGKHGAGNLEFQEFHVLPSPGIPYHEGLEMAEEIYQTVKKVLIRHGAVHSVGDEGGFAPNLFTNMDALEVVTLAISESGHDFKKSVFLGLDVAASHFYRNGQYSIRDRTQPMEANELVEYYRDLCKQYPLYFLEDPLFEEDWSGWTRLTQELLGKTFIVGDDLLCTNPERVKKAIEEKACNAILVKPNQIGTISETLSVIKLAREAGWKVIVSHRSGETNDSFIADFAVGVGADFTKFGAPARGERVAKYNRLLDIENELNREK